MMVLVVSVTDVSVPVVVVFVVSVELVVGAAVVVVVGGNVVVVVHVSQVPGQSRRAGTALP